MAALLWIACERQVSAAHLDFRYGSTVTPSPINPTSTIAGPGSQVSQAGEGNFTSPTAPTLNAGLNGAAGTNITVGTLNVTDLSIGAYMDTYGPTTITIDLKLLDVDSGKTGVFTFTGTLSGLVSSDGTTSAANITVKNFSPVDQIENIGGTAYEVRVLSGNAFSAPGSPPVDGTGLNGEYSLNVRAAAVPEPTSIGLLAVGCLSVMVCRAATRRRR
jgi:hypothetical protein